MWRWGVYLGKKTGRGALLTFHTQLLEPGSHSDRIVKPRFWIRIYFGFMVSLSLSHPQINKMCFLIPLNT